MTPTPHRLDVALHLVRNLAIRQPLFPVPHRLFCFFKILMLERALRGAKPFPSPGVRILNSAKMATGISEYSSAIPLLTERALIFPDLCDVLFAFAWVHPGF